MAGIFSIIAPLGLAAVILHSFFAFADPPPAWKSFHTGGEYAKFKIVEKPNLGDGFLHAARFAPNLVKFDFYLAAERGDKTRTAAQWCTEFGLIAVINAGMYQTDYRKNVGYLQHGETINNLGWKQTYQALFAFDPRSADQPKAAMFDLDAPGGKEVHKKYKSAVQNLRLIKGKGVNVWGKQEKQWSEAAVAMDAKGRILFLFSRTPLTMWEFNEKIGKLPLEIVRAMHVEGGPEASFSICSPNLALHLNGSFETGFNESDNESHQWPIPNVIGVSKSK
jgi:hypothetical protein